MKIAIMQPYVFPYIGYFQLINAVDTFVFYDDVNFIKQGWINRNRILCNQQDYTFTVPIENISSFKKINETIINQPLYNKWKKKFLKLIEQNYSKSPEFKKIYPNLILLLDKNYHTISDLAIESILWTLKMLDIEKKTIRSSKKYNNSHMERTERIIDICSKEKAKTYINSLGGKKLYNKDYFKLNEIQLNFIENTIVPYQQFKNSFIPGLSIIDTLMFNSKEEIQKMLTQYTLS